MPFYYRQITIKNREIIVKEASSKLQTTVKLPSNYRQIGAKLSPDYRQTTVKLPSNCRRITVELPSNFRRITVKMIEYSIILLRCQKTTLPYPHPNPEPEPDLVPIPYRTVQHAIDLLQRIYPIKVPLKYR